MPWCARRRRRSTPPRPACTGWSKNTCCGPGTSPRSVRTSAPTHPEGWRKLTSPFADRPGAVGDPPQHYGSPLAEQRDLAAGLSIVDLSDRDVVTVTGPDRLT